VITSLKIKVKNSKENRIAGLKNKSAPILSFSDHPDKLFCNQDIMKDG
jgi:hypothetical protein